MFKPKRFRRFLFFYSLILLNYIKFILHFQFLFLLYQKNYSNIKICASKVFNFSFSFSAHILKLFVFPFYNIALSLFIFIIIKIITGILFLINLLLSYLWKMNKSFSCLVINCVGYTIPFSFFSNKFQHYPVR